MAYGDFKYLTGRTATDKVLRYKAFNIFKNRKFNGYQCGLTLMLYTFLIKKTPGGAVKKEIIQTEELSEELQKPITRKFEKQNYIHLL